MVCKLKKIKTLALCLMFTAPLSKADFSLSNQEINTIGSHDGNVMFLTLKSNELSNAGCNFSVLYCPDTRPSCKSMLSLAMMAKSTLAKVDLSVAKDAGNGCTLQMMVLK